MSVPSITTSPWSGRIKPQSIFRGTLLPLAPGPISPYKQPAGTCSVTSESTGAR